MLLTVDDDPAAVAVCMLRDFGARENGNVRHDAYGRWAGLVRSSQRASFEGGRRNPRIPLVIRLQHRYGVKHRHYLTILSIEVFWAAVRTLATVLDRVKTYRYPRKPRAHINALSNRHDDRGS